MAVYVDNLIPCIPNKNWQYKKSCHLIADTEKELHEFALSIGLKRSWYQGNSSISHYDLTASKRVQAVRGGARQISRTQFVDKMRKARNRKDNPYKNTIHGSKVTVTDGPCSRCYELQNCPSGHICQRLRNWLDDKKNGKV